MFRLTLNFSGKSVKKYNFDQDSVCIGREGDCEIIIDNLGVSRRHATIEKANTDYILTDLKSHNGTFVRGQRIYHHQLTDGDEFYIGKYSIQFENLDLSTEPAAPIPQVEANQAGMQDMTFRLEKTEIEKIMGASSSGSVPKLAQIFPEKEQTAYRLENFYYLVGKHPAATIKLQGMFAPSFAAILVKNEKWFHVVSLSNRCPVKVNGKRALDHMLSEGDIFEIGRRKFRFGTG